MPKLMVIDAAHSEETRVAVVNNGLIEEFDYQNAYKKSVKSNIYLAKVVRIEPSLQAAFVDYGAEKHAFLPFPEIHPSYYQIPAADKEALLASIIETEEGKKSLLEQNGPIEQFDIEEEVEEEKKELPLEDGGGEQDLKLEDEESEVELIAQDTEETSDETSRPNFYQNYRIQEVIKKDQILLIQVVKEERGNKGAAVTTYISLAGRYCVLMPNSIKAGGISRKIMDAHERKRLKSLADELNQKSGNTASIIIRTAGAHKTKIEVKRDFNYLIRLWNNIREHTLASKAPAFIHEEGDVIKTSIRDLYNGDITQIIVSGEEAYQNAHKFMGLILPHQVGSVKKYKGKSPIFIKYHIESQLNMLYDPVAPLKSGGYIVINHTEALVAIDVNSGRATSERNVENTAYRTNLEAAWEIARQIKLRDLSGLIVIDFIDMEDSRNRRAVERAFKDALYHDRARIQVGRISTFGLLEMTRQRLRQSFFESSTNICSNCEGRGRIRPVEATAIALLRALDNELCEGGVDEIKISGSADLIFYIFNNKREEISKLEKATKVKVIFYIDEEAGADGFFIEKSKKTTSRVRQSALSAIDVAPYVVEENQSDEEDALNQKELSVDKASTSDSGSKKRWKKSNNLNHPSHSSQQSSKRSEQEPNMRRKAKKNHNFHHKHKNQELESLPAEEDENFFEESMKNKRKEHQSFLKEIWKKIVE